MPVSNRPVYITNYDDKWPDQYREVEEPLSAAFEEYALDIQHIGSTSIPELAAKPVIDVAVGLSEYPLPESVISAVEALGYTHRGEYGIEGRHYFVRYSSGTGGPDVHLHAYSPGNNEWTAHILFRDYLRAHPEAAREYEALKRDLAARYTNERETYTTSKADFVMETLEKARKELSQF